jgi:hypothetical protein
MSETEDAGPYGSGYATLITQHETTEEEATEE